jgi:hypothetical protein
MIVANISTFRGQDVTAVHYYCSYEKIQESIPRKYYNGGHNNEIKKTIKTQKEADSLNKKDNCWKFSLWKIGDKTNRFDSIDEIHSTLKKLFKKQTIVTYYECQLFRKMLYFKDGVNLGYKFFGETWNSCPSSVWKDILPKNEVIKIKCGDCGKEYNLEDVSYERECENRILIQFYRRSEMDEPCCKYFSLEWNIIL